MKYLIPALFGLLALSCEPEEIIKYVEKVTYKDRLIIQIDTIVITKEVIKTEYDTIVEYDTIIEVITEHDTIIQIKEVVRVDTVEKIVEVTDTVYLPRETILQYPDYWESTVSEWLERVEEANIALPRMDVKILEGIMPRGPQNIQTHVYLFEGVWIIHAEFSVGDQEVNVWRGLSHLMLGKRFIYLGDLVEPTGAPPIPGSAEDNIMFQAFPSIVYWDATEERKQKYWEDMFNGQ